MDPTILLEWVAHDRGIATFASGEEIRATKAALTALVKKWLEALE